MKKPKQKSKKVIYYISLDIFINTQCIKNLNVYWCNTQHPVTYYKMSQIPRTDLGLIHKFGYMYIPNTSKPGLLTDENAWALMSLPRRALLVSMLPRKTF